MPEIVEYKVGSTQVGQIYVMHNTSHYSTKELLKFVLWAIELPVNQTKNGYSHSRGHGPLVRAARNSGKVRMTFAPYAGKADQVVRVERVGGWGGEGILKVRIKGPVAALSSLEQLAAAGAVPDSECGKYAAYMPLEFRAQLATELYARLVGSMSGHTDLTPADLPLSGIPPLPALHQAPRPTQEQKVEEARVQLLQRSRESVGDLGGHLSHFVSAQVKHLNYILRRARTCEMDELVSATEDTLRAVEALRAFESRFADYSNLLHAAIKQQKERS